MKELFKRIRLEAYLTSLLTIAAGVMLVAWPMEVTGLICRIFGVMLIVMGAVHLFSYFMEGTGMFSVAGGLLFLLLGVWIFTHPGSVAQLVPICIGVVMIVHSLKDFQMASETKHSGRGRWQILFILALLNCALGVICICDSFGVLSLAVRVLGIALIYDGVSDIIIVYHTVKAVKDATAALEPIDVESHDL